MSEKIKNLRGSVCTSTGMELNFLDTSVESITLSDIAEGLSKCARYAGQTPGKFYSVAEHSVLVSRLVPRDLKRAALLHDASEAFTGDVSSPLKSLIGSVFTNIEDQITYKVFKAFQVPVYDDEDYIHPDIHKADHLMFLKERAELMPKTKWWPQEEYPTIMPSIKCLEWQKARKLYIDEFMSS